MKIKLELEKDRIIVFENFVLSKYPGDEFDFKLDLDATLLWTGRVSEPHVTGCRKIKAPECDLCKFATACTLVRLPSNFKVNMALMMVEAYNIYTVRTGMNVQCDLIKKQYVEVEDEV